jgi:hypothetical protein
MRIFCSAPAVGLLVVALVLSGCSDATKKTFGLEANPPDAFTVGTQPPLSIPPELGALPPPNPGEPRPQEVDAAQAGANTLDAENAITPPPASGTPGEQALLDAAGPAPPPGIRAAVNQQALVASEPPGFVSKMMGNGPAPVPTVDANAETRRIQENEALGEPVTNGATPQDSNKQPGFFARMFGWL